MNRFLALLNSVVVLTLICQTDLLADRAMPRTPAELLLERINAELVRIENLGVNVVVSLDEEDGPPTIELHEIGEKIFPIRYSLETIALGNPPTVLFVERVVGSRFEKHVRPRHPDIVHDFSDEVGEILDDHGIDLSDPESVYRAQSDPEFQRRYTTHIDHVIAALTKRVEYFLPRGVGFGGDGYRSYEYFRPLGEIDYDASGRTGPLRGTVLAAGAAALSAIAFLAGLAIHQNEVPNQAIVAPYYLAATGVGLLAAWYLWAARERPLKLNPYARAARQELNEMLSRNPRRNEPIRLEYLTDPIEGPDAHIDSEVRLIPVRREDWPAPMSEEPYPGEIQIRSENEGRQSYTVLGIAGDPSDHFRLAQQSILNALVIAHQNGKTSLALPADWGELSMYRVAQATALAINEYLEWSSLPPIVTRVVLAGIPAVNISETNALTDIRLRRTSLRGYPTPPPCELALADYRGST